MKNNSVVIGWTTFGSSGEAETFARKVLEKKLAACVQVDGPMRSFYFWKGEVQEEVETRLWIKTTEEAIGSLTGFLVENDSYDTPQWVWVRTDGLSKEYGDWVRDSVSI